VHLASQDPNKTRDLFLLKKHPKGTKGSGSVDHIAFLAKNPDEVRSRIQKNKVEMHFRSFPDAKLFQIFLKDPDDVTIELNFPRRGSRSEEMGRPGVGFRGDPGRRRRKARKQN
jgi:hypothetical protein